MLLSCLFFPLPSRLSSDPLQLKGKLNGIALRVPTPNVSIVDLVIQTEKKTFAEEVNQAFREAAAGELKVSGSEREGR